PVRAFQRRGGGAFDPATTPWGQGAFNADDMTRAAVVYLRHWRQFGDQASRDHAYQLLRGVTYLQTSSGPNAGNVVLWMQPDGTLNPSPTPTEEPDPSDSGPSYWLARTIWALGEGYAAFRTAHPALARVARGGVGALPRAPPPPPPPGARPALRDLPDGRRAAPARLADRRRRRRLLRGRLRPERLRPRRRGGPGAARPAAA